MGRPTILDVARRAGVSAAVVSHVINENPAHVGEVTRRRVKSVIAEIGYRPSGVAKSLRRRHTRTLGLVICDATSALFAPVARGVEAVASRAGYQVLLVHAPDPATEREALAVLAAHPVEGVILMAVSTRQKAPHLAEAGELPIAVINRYGVGPRFTRIRWDDRSGARLAVAHLFGLGHRRIGFIGGPRTGPAARLSAIRRLEGFRAAHQAAGIPLSECLIIPGDYTVGAGVDGAQCLCGPGRRPTAILASDDTMAMGVLRGILDLGLRCPEDVAVVGIGDPPFMAFANPPLTTVALPVEGAGARAAECILEQVEDPDERPRTEILPCRLVVRASCGAESLRTDRVVRLAGRRR